MTEQGEKRKKWIDKIYMLHENELWLAEQAEKGLIPEKFDDKYVYFTEAASEKIKYKIIVLNEKKAEDHIKMIARQGFSFAGNYEEYHLFRISGNYSRIEPRLNSEMLEFVRKWFGKKIRKTYIGTITLLVGAAVKILFNHDRVIQSVIEIPAMWYVIFGLLFIYLAVNGIKEYRAIFRTKKYLFGQEETLPGKRPKGKAAAVMPAVMRTFLILICVLIAGSLIKEIYFKEDTLYSIGDIQQYMPMVLLEDLETNDLPGMAEGSQSTVNKNDYAEINHSLLAAKQYKAWQGTSDNSMRVFYYEVATDKLAEPLTKELLNDKVFEVKKEDLKRVYLEDLDSAYIWQEGDLVKVSACKGKKVMYIFNIGDIPAGEILKKMAEVL